MVCIDLVNRMINCDLCSDLCISDSHDHWTCWDSNTPYPNWGFQQPEVVVTATDTGWAYSIDIPGMAKDAISIAPQCGTLLVSWERKGRRYQTTIVLEKGALIESISASLRDGVLEIKVPRAVAVSPQKIKID